MNNKTNKEVNIPYTGVAKEQRVIQSLLLCKWGNPQTWSHSPHKTNVNSREFVNLKPSPAKVSKQVGHSIVRDQKPEESAFVALIARSQEGKAFRRRQNALRLRKRHDLVRGYTTAGGGRRVLHLRFDKVKPCLPRHLCLQHLQQQEEEVERVLLRGLR
jgi:hypothetical protein